MIRQLFFRLCLNEITVTVAIIVVLLFWKKAERAFTIRAWKCVCIVMLIRLLIAIPGIEQMTVFHLDISPKESVAQLIQDTDYSKNQQISNEEIEQKKTIESDAIEEKNALDASKRDYNRQRNWNVNVTSENIMQVLFIAWLVVAILRLIYAGLSYAFLYHKLERYDQTVDETEVKDILKAILHENGIAQEVNVYYSEDIATPLVLGLEDSFIVIPAQNYTREELSFIFQHECKHIKHKDTILKMMLYIARCIHWWNPFVLRFCRLVNDFLEECCDYYVVRNKNEEYRKAYCYNILNVLERNVHRKSRRMIGVTSLADGKSAIRHRLNRIMGRPVKKNAWVTLVVLYFLIGMSVFLVGFRNDKASIVVESPVTSIVATTERENEEVISNIQVENKKEIQLGKDYTYADCYTTNLYRGRNHFWIDENRTLWGSGVSDYGQLGELQEDSSVTIEAVPIAYNVKHVDFSGEYFLIFLTEDNRLYGLGGNPAGILNEERRQEFNSIFMNVVLEPVLLMENVAFAKCGYTTIIAMLENGDVYVMGNNRYEPLVYEEYVMPQKVMENARYVTTYYQSYAVVDNNNCLWTWGNNRFGQCGNGTFSDMVEEPQKVMEHVLCAWMGRVSFSGGNVIPEQDNLVVFGTDDHYYGCGEGIGNNYIQDASDDFDIGHMDMAAKIKTSNVLQKIEVNEYENNYRDE
ncbi:MAG: hypothetical protein J6C01_07955 [Lachnospiraceae bacterium]|nr:hypothetical protein [Lachnospiraceae bacterium]